MLDERYRIEHRLGRGGMGIVFRAHDVFLDRTVAIKALDVDHCGEESMLRFRKEARALAQVRHDNVCQIYAFGTHQGASYFAMEHIAGRDLDSLIGGGMPVEQAMPIFRQIARGLAAVHARRVVHRDVKPSNVIVEDGTQRTVLIDFGLAQRPQTQSTNITLVGGTPSYMAPEQAMDPTGYAAGPRADIYALACSFFEMVTGRLPFEGTTAIEILSKHLKDAPPAISTVRAQLAPFDAVLRRAMSKTPADRQSSCDELLAEVEEAAKRIARKEGRITLSDKAPVVRVIIAESDDGLRRNLTRVIERTLSGAGDRPEIRQTADASTFASAVATLAADIVVIDEECVGGDACALVEAVRTTAGGDAAEVLVLTRDPMTPDARLTRLGARQLPKPLNPQVLGAVITRMGTRVAERRRVPQEQR